MADRRGRSRRRVTSQYNINDHTNWTKAKLRSKLQDLGIQTHASFSKTVLIQMYQKNKNVSRNATDLPTVRILQRNYIAIIGEQAKLECSISATPLSTTVSWQRISPEGQTVTLDIDEIKYTGSKPNYPHLVIEDIRKDDEGNYLCTVSNGYGERRSIPTKLKVKGGPQTLNMKPKTYYQTEGGHVILKCNVIAEPPASNITWIKEEEGREREIAIDNDKYHGGVLQSPSLIIAETEKMYDDGKYICEAENHAGQGRNSVHLTIQSKSANTETVETTHKEGIKERISLRHSRMVNALSKRIFPKANHWADFIQLVSVYVPTSELGNDLQDNVSYLKRMGHISCGHYKKLFDVVKEIDKEASLIIKEAEADIKTIRKGGMPKETTTELECTFEGSYNPNLPQKCTSQITEQYREVNSRITGVGRKGSIVLKFTISEAQTPHQSSALYLAVTLRTRLQNRQIVLKDESDVPLVLKTTPKVTIPTENPKDVPTIRLSRGHYQFTEGKVAILKCVVVATAETESIQWVRVKDGKSNVICIDNEKYFGGLPQSPSLAIGDVKKSDRGIYFCKARNRAGEAESDTAFVEINSIDDLGDISTRKEEVSTVMEDAGTVMKDAGSMKEDNGKQFQNRDLTNGFDEVPEYNTGLIATNTPELDDSTVFIFGSESHLTRSMLVVDGLKTRPLSCVLKHTVTKWVILTIVGDICYMSYTVTLPNGRSLVIVYMLIS